MRSKVFFKSEGSEWVVMDRHSNRKSNIRSPESLSMVLSRGVELFSGYVTHGKTEQIVSLHEPFSNTIGSTLGTVNSN